jgi:hypothetical protein
MIFHEYTDSSHNPHYFIEGYAVIKDFFTEKDGTAECMAVKIEPSPACSHKVILKYLLS